MQPQNNTPSVRIPDVNRVPVNVSINPGWFFLGWNPGDDTTYRVEFLEFFATLQAGLFREIPQADFLTEANSGQLSAGRYSRITNRTGTRPDSDVVVMELGGNKVGAAVEMFPDANVNGSFTPGDVVPVQYVWGSDTIVALVGNAGGAPLPYAENAYGVHPYFGTQHALNIWLIQHSNQNYTGPTYQATSQTYTTIGSDFSDKCGPGTVGVAITRTSSNGSSTISQQHANQLALMDARAKAIAAIVCPVPSTPTNPTPPATYSHLLNVNSQIGPDGLSFVPGGSETFEYNALTTPTSGPTVSVVINSGGFASYLDYNSENGGRPFRFTNRNGVQTSGTLPNSDAPLNL